MRKILWAILTLLACACHKKDALQGDDYSQWYSEQEGLAVIQGDIVLGQLAEVASKYGGTAAAALKGVRKGIGPIDESTFHLWVNGVVPYVLPPDFPKPERIHTAMYDIEYNSGIRFVPRTNESDYLTFVRAPGWCSSYLGRIGGSQSIYISDLCTRGNILHELGHAIGLFHEQSRSDRDAYVKINWENIMPGAQINFMKDADFGIPLFKVRKDIGTYDLDSVMQSDPVAYSKNGLPTISTVDGSPFGQRKKLSAGDIAAIRYLYGENGQLAGHTGPGAPDRDFGDLGELRLDFGRESAANGNIARQADGKILVVGSNVVAPSFGPPGTPSPYQTIVARFTATGATDPAFGVNGKVTIAHSNYSEAYGVAVLSDGKILVAGGSNSVYRMSGGINNGFVTRLLPNGAVDASFGSGGTFLRSNETFTRLRILSDGKLIVMNGGSSICRLTSAGALDTTFPGGGCNSFYATLGGYADEIEVLPDGTLYAATGGNYGTSYAVARLLPNGTLDSTFGTSGKSQSVSPPADMDWTGGHIAVYPDGKVIITYRMTRKSASVISEDGFVLIRYLSDGTLDSAFGTNGVVTAFISEGGRATGPIYSMLPQADGKIFLNGWAGIQRRNANGSLDTTFNPVYGGGDGIAIGNGRVTTHSNYYGGGYLYQMRLQ